MMGWIAFIILLCVIVFVVVRLLRRFWNTF